MAQRKKPAAREQTWTTSWDLHTEGSSTVYEATFDLQCVDAGGDRALGELLRSLEIAGCEIVDDAPGLVTGGTTAHRIRLRFPAEHTMRTKMTRNAGRRPKHLSLPAGSVFTASSTVGEFLAWFDDDGDKGHTDAEGMEQLGVGSKSTFRRWVKRARGCDPGEPLWRV